MLNKSSSTSDIQYSGISRCNRKNSVWLLQAAGLIIYRQKERSEMKLIQELCRKQNHSTSAERRVVSRDEVRYSYIEAASSLSRPLFSNPVRQILYDQDHWKETLMLRRTVQILAPIIPFSNNTRVQAANGDLAVEDVTRCRRQILGSRSSNQGFRGVTMDEANPIHLVRTELEHRENVSLGRSSPFLKSGWFHGRLSFSPFPSPFP
jgi:hypothetical protein